MGSYLRKYATATTAGTHVGIPMPKAGSSDFAVGVDWTPVAGDVLVSIDGAAQAQIATLPAYSNGQWVYQLSIAETTGKSIRVTIVDAAMKAVDDQFFSLETYGNASALHPMDLATPVPTVAQNAAGMAAAPVGSVAGNVGGSVATVTDKAGYALAATGLDAVTATPQAGTPTTFTGRLNWLCQHLGLGTVIKDSTAGTIVTKAGSSVLTTQGYTSTATVDTVNAPS
jgi:hypothetical protein